MEALNFKLRPESTLPVPFFILGLVGLGAAATTVVAFPEALIRFPLPPRGIFLLHLVTLGGVTPVIMGAYYQLVPVVLHAGLPRPSLGHWILGLLAASVSVFLAGWFTLHPAWIASGGVVAGVALYLFVGHVATALARLRQPTVPATAFALALLFLAGTATLGPVLALSLSGVLSLPGGLTPVLAAHAALGLGGWFLLTMIGASYQLMPFFAATDPALHARWGYVAVALVAAGALLIATHSAPTLGSALGLVGVAAWGADIARLARHGRQARREPVVSFTGAAVGAILLASAATLARILGWRNAPTTLPTAIAYLGLVAGPVLLIAGQLQKILPFIAALDVSLAAKRRGRVPKTEALFPRRPAFVLFFALASGFLGVTLSAALGSAVGVRAAGSLVLLATCTYIGYQARAVRVWWRVRRQS